MFIKISQHFVNKDLQKCSICSIINIMTAVGMKNCGGREN
jgi:hypothetical protein